MCRVTISLVFKVGIVPTLSPICDLEFMLASLGMGGGIGKCEVYG